MNIKSAPYKQWTEKEWLKTTGNSRLLSCAARIKLLDKCKNSVGLYSTILSRYIRTIIRKKNYNCMNVKIIYNKNLNENREHVSEKWKKNCWMQNINIYRHIDSLNKER